MSESMEIDPPHESDGSTTESKESETIVAADMESGIGLPYAPENFPQPGDTWSWKVGKRIASKGHFLDRYLYIPDRLYQELKSTNPINVTKSRGFASKKAVERFVMETFPGMDIKAFFASFRWKIPSGKVKDRAENTDTNTDTVVYCTPKFDPAGCKAGNINCSSLLVINNPDHFSNIMPCDLCCIEPRFCHDCCCILCSRPVSFENIDLGFIKCEAVVKDGLICGHICHIECGLRSYMAGTVGGTVGLDAEYYCRRCDARTDLIPHVKNLFKSCESNSDGDKMQKILSLCAIMLRGSTKTSAKSLLHHVQLAAAKLKEGNSEDIWKLEDASAVTTEMDLFSVVRLTRPKQVTVGVRPLREGEEPVLEATAGRTMEIVQEEPEDVPSAILEAIPIRSFPTPGVQVPVVELSHTDSSESVGIAMAESGPEEVSQGVKRKSTFGDDGAGTSKRKRHVISGGQSSSEEDASPTKTPSPNVEATDDDAAHVGSSPPKASPSHTDDLAQKSQETEPKAFEDVPTDHLIEKLGLVAAHQASLVAQLQARYAGEGSRCVQKDEEIVFLKAQLADAQAEVKETDAYAQKLAEEKMSLLAQVSQESVGLTDYKATCLWALKYMELNKNAHFSRLDEFRKAVEGSLEKQEVKLRKLSIEYDEELYPHLVSSIAERRWLISHGLRLATLSTLESQEVREAFGDVVECALARGKAQAIEELSESKLLTVPAAQVPGYNADAYDELVAAMEKMKLLDLPHIAQLERDQDYPIGVMMEGLTLARHTAEDAEAQPDYFLKPDVSQLQVLIFARPRSILNPFALEKEIPLRESLEAHATRRSKKQGVKGKAILCVIGAAHVPRSDGVPVSVPTVSPKHSDLLKNLEEAGSDAYHVSSSELRRSHSL